MGYENDCVWDGHQRGFQEVWYLAFRDLASGDSYWLRYLLLSPREGERQFSVGICRLGAQGDSQAVVQRFSLRDFRHRRGAQFKLRLGEENIFENDFCQGRIQGSRGIASWELKFPGAELAGLRAYHHLPPLLRRGPWARLKICAPHWAETISGTVTLHGVERRLSRAAATQAHLWGPHWPRRWAWVHTSQLSRAREEERTPWVLEMLSASLPWFSQRSWTSCCLAGPEDCYEIAGVLEGLQVRSEFSPGKWRLRGRCQGRDLEVTVSAPLSSLVLAHAQEAGGGDRFCAHSGQAAVGVVLHGNRKQPEEEIWETPHGAHFEVGGDQPFAESIPLVFSWTDDRSG